MINLVINC